MSRYDVEKFVPQPDQELICCICTNVLDEPMESPCRHVFCKICIETWLNNRRTCPTCRFTVTNGDLKPVLPLVRNMLNKLTLICDFSDNGCKDLVLLEKYQNHIKACDYEKVVCRYPKCAKSMLRKLIKSHEDEKCKYREILCEKDCGLKITVGSVETHDCLKALKAFCENKDKETETLKGELIELKNAFEKIREEVNNFKKEYIRQRNNSWESSSTSNQDSDYSVIDWDRSRSPSRSRSRSPLPLYHVLSSARRRSHSRTRSRSRSRSRSHTSTRSRSSTRYNTSYSTSPRRSPYSSGSSVDSFPLRQRDRDEQEAILNSINLVSESFPLLDRNLNRAHDLLLTINNPVPIVRCVQCEELQENCQCDHHSEYSEGPSLTSYTEEGQFSSDNENPDEDHQSSEHNTTVDGSPESQRHRSFSEEHSNDSYSPTPVEGQNVSFSYNPTPLNQSPPSTTGPAQRSRNLSSQSEDKMAQIPLVVDMDTWSGRVETVNTSPISRMEPSYSPRSRTSSSSSLSSERSRSRSPVSGSSHRVCSSESVNNSPGDRSQRHSSHSPEPGYSPSGYRTCSSSSSCSSSKSYNYSPTRKRKRSKSPDASPSLKSSSPNSSVSGPCYRASERIDSDTDHKHNSFDSSRAQKKQRVCKDLNYSRSEWSPKSDVITEYNPTSISELSKSRYRFKINEGASTSSQHSDYVTNQHQHLNNSKYSSNDETDNERKTAKKSKRKGGGKKRKRSKRKLHHSEHIDFSGNEQETEDLSASKPKLKSIVGLVTPNSKIKFIVRKSNGELMSSESSEDTN